MQITVSKGMINLNRYAGTDMVDGKRRPFKVNIGQFSENARPEFARNELDVGSGRIPWVIYRNTTPLEQDLIVSFIRKRRRDNALPTLIDAVASLESITDVDGLEVPEQAWKRLQSAVRLIKKCVVSKASVAVAAAVEEQSEEQPVEVAQSEESRSDSSQAAAPTAY